MISGLWCGGWLGPTDSCVLVLASTAWYSADIFKGSGA